MKIGIVGLPNVGKSTLFNALTKSYSADAANFPFCTIEPNIGIVDVKDQRLDKLSQISNSKNKVYATTKFVDIAGLVKGASKGEGLGNKFLANIREVDAIVQVVRLFSDGEVVHVDGNIDPIRDIETINTELILSDLEQIEIKLPSIEKKAKSTKDKESENLVSALGKARTALLSGKLIWDIREDFTDEEQKSLKSYSLLTYKPFIYAINISESDLITSDSIKNQYYQKLNKPIAIVSAKFESEIISFDENEKNDYIKDLFPGADISKIPTLNELIKLGFDTLNLMYYFTTGEKESRAWNLKKGSTAPQAAGVIHTDFEKGFIKAEVVNYEKFVVSGSWTKAKENGFVRLEGKDYIVQDGDIIFFKFNV